PTCSVSENLEGVDEMRPGNFIFYDVMQAEIGSCSYEEIAVALACPVVAKYPERNEIVVYGGAVHFSKDRIENESGTSMYGLVAQKSASGWDNPTPGLYMKKLSQEHGTIHATDEFIRQTKIGDILYILPIHSCLTANLMGKYFTLEGRELGMYRFGF
ncbi:alanine racemase, partial [Marivirga lumbricoides]